MLNNLISWSLRNRYIVLVLAVILFIVGIYAVKKNPIDAIPDLSENQVILFTAWEGKSQRIIEDQITYPLITNLQGLPRVKYVRGSSMFGMSFIYVIFQDNVDIYWARERVLERINTVTNQLPEGVRPTLGPDGTGVGHILWYTLDIPDMDLGEQRALQDWYIKFALQNIPGVSEIASFGGFQKQYQIIINPNKLLYYHVSMQDIIKAVRTNNNETGGRKLEMSDIGYIIQTSAYLKSVNEIEAIVLKEYNSIPVTIKDVAYVQMAGAARLEIFDQNGDGERVGGIVVMRYGGNVTEIIDAVKEKMEALKKGLPENVNFDIIYDRGKLIKEAIHSVKHTLIEEMIVVSFIVLLFLMNLRSALSILIQIPMSIAISFVVLNFFNISSNIMSLTGIVLAIGVIVDNGIIISENTYKNLSERYAAYKKSKL